MKHLTLILILLISFQPNTTKAAGDGMLLATALCELTKADNRSQIRKKISRAKVKLRKIYADTTCNGMHLWSWAKKFEAVEAMKYYETKMGKRIADEIANPEGQ